MRLPRLAARFHPERDTAAPVGFTISNASGLGWGHTSLIRRWVAARAETGKTVGAASGRAASYPSRQFAAWNTTRYPALRFMALAFAANSIRRASRPTETGPIGTQGIETPGENT